jgi:hypothetical protein
LYRRQAVPESRFGRCGVEKISLPGIEPSVVQPVAIPTELPRLLFIIIIIIIIITNNNIAKFKELSFDPVIKYELLLTARK